MNVYEMEGFLRGKCMPRDILVNESTAAYLVRKLNEATTVKAEHDALAVESAAMRSEILNITFMDDEVFFSCDQRAQELMGRLVNIKTPATDAALAAIEVRGVDKLADKLDAEIEQIMRGAFFYDEISSREAISKMVREFANELREAK